MQRYSFWIKLTLISLLVLFALFHINISTYQKYWNENIFDAIVLIQPFLFINLFLISVRFNFILGKNHPSIMKTINSVLIGYGLTPLLPGRSSELLRPIYLKENANTKISHSLTALIIEKIIDLVILGVISLIFISHYTPEKFLLLWLLLGAVPIITLFFFKQASPVLVKLSKTLLPSNKLKQLAISVIQDTQDSLMNKGLLKSFATAILAWLFSLTSIYLYFYIASPVSLSFTTSTTIFLLTTISGAIPLLPGGFGLYEAAAIFVLKKIGISFPEALILALGLHISQIGLPTVIGLSLAIKRKTGISSLISKAQKMVKNLKK